MLSFLPAALLTAHQFLWEQRSISCHQLPCPHSRALPGSHSPPWFNHKPNPAMLRAVCLVHLGLLCCTSRGSCSAQEGPEVPPVVLFSASPCTPILVCNVYITAETGKNIRCVQAGLVFLKSPCVSCQMDRRGLLPLPMVCCTLLPSGQPSTRHPLLLSLPSSSHCICLDPSQLLFLQPLET